MQRIGFIFLAGCLTLKGFLHTVHYHPPVLKREWTNHPNLTEDDVAQIIRIRLVAEPLRFFSGLFIHPVVSLAPLEAGCMLYLFFSAAWKYTSSDTKATISGIFQRSFFGPLIETEGRIRLD
jgi:hypothetical protein